MPDPRQTSRPASRPAQPLARPLEPLLTIKQAAELLQVSDKTLRRRIAEGGLVAHRIGAQWRLAPRDIAEYLRESRVP
ncbi:MAG: helix-turn-helix domain-containing protein [Acetobacteraceae bacterium]|nr:helix-turn-helix domain-containing protein [Acetobacteraceae bacterium]